MSSPHRRGFTIRIFVPSGIPDGLKVIEKSNWTGRGIVFPRALIKDAQKRPDFDRTGVYILVGPSEVTDLPKIYVGEGDTVKSRLIDHDDKRDFWTQGIYFVSKDETINKAHIQHIESRLIDLLHLAKRSDIENRNRPQLPSMSEADAAEADAFLDEMLLCLPLLGISAFEQPAVQPETNIRLLHLSSRGVIGTGYDSAQGFVVRKDSQAVKTETNSIHAYMHELREELVRRGVLIDNGECYRVTQDYVFNSPSTAAGVLLGRATNGRVDWKDAEGRTLKELQQASDHS